MAVKSVQKAGLILVEMSTAALSVRLEFSILAGSHELHVKLADFLCRNHPMKPYYAKCAQQAYAGKGSGMTIRQDAYQIVSSRLAARAAIVRTPTRNRTAAAVMKGRRIIMPTNKSSSERAFESGQVPGHQVPTDRHTVCVGTGYFT